MGEDEASSGSEAQGEAMPGYGPAGTVHRVTPGDGLPGQQPNQQPDPQPNQHPDPQPNQQPDPWTTGLLGQASNESNGWGPPTTSRSTEPGNRLREWGALLAILSILPTLLIVRMIFTPNRDPGSWSSILLPILVTVLVPLAALVLLVAASLVRRGAGLGTKVPVAATVFAAGSLLIAVASGGLVISSAAQREIDYSPDLAVAPPISQPFELETDRADEVSGLIPDTPETSLTAAELQAGMHDLLAIAVEAAGKHARWVDPALATEDIPDAVVDPATASTIEPSGPVIPPIVAIPCLDTGVSFPIPATTFATGVITDTSSDEHDREVTASNVAAAERIVEAWEGLGYVEDSGLGGNIMLAGRVGAPAVILKVNYSFGFVTLRGESRCVLPD